MTEPEPKSQKEKPETDLTDEELDGVAGGIIAVLATPHMNPPPEPDKIGLSDPPEPDKIGIVSPR